MYATWLIVAKMDLLTAAGPAVNTILVAVTPVSLAVGWRSARGSRDANPTSTPGWAPQTWMPSPRSRPKK